MTNNVIGTYITAFNPATGGREIWSPHIFSDYTAAFNFLHANLPDAHGCTDHLILPAWDAQYKVSPESAMGVLRQEYFDDVEAIVDELVRHLEEREVTSAGELGDQLLETVDNHRRVIYTGNAIQTLLFSPNDDAALNEVTLAGLSGEGIPYSELAFYALRADVEERLAARGIDLNAPFHCAECGTEFPEADELAPHEGRSLCPNCLDELMEEENESND